MFINKFGFMKLINYVENEYRSMSPGDKIHLTFIEFDKIKDMIKSSSYIELLNYILDNKEDFESVYRTGDFKYIFSYEEVKIVLYNSGFFHVERKISYEKDQDICITLVATKPMYDGQSPESQRRASLKPFIDQIKNKAEKTLVEVGCFTGESTRLFSEKFEKVYAVDPYLGNYDNNDSASKSDMNIAEQIFDEYVGKFDNVEKVKNISLVAADQFLDNSVDVVYIDASHKYEEVKKDINTWFKKVKLDGIISGHDYDWVEVKNAVDECFGDINITVDGCNWWVEKKKCWDIKNSPEKNKIAIVITTSDHLEQNLKPCIESLIKYTNLDNKIVYIVSNGYDDNTEKYLQELNKIHPNIQGIHFSKPLGATVAANFGFKKVENYNFITYLNDDCVLLPQKKDEWVNRLKNPLLNSDKTLLCGVIKTYCPHANRLFIPTFCAMFKKEMLTDIGYFDETFNPGAGEDTDLCCKIEDSGFSFVDVSEDNGVTDNFLTGNFPIYHVGDVTVSKLKDWDKIFERNSRILKERYGN